MSVSEKLVEEQPPPAAPSSPSERPRSSTGLVVAAVALSTVPILIAAVRGIARGWEPTGDDAYSAVRAHDVFGGHLPLLGTWSSVSQFSGHWVNHPGPLQFDFLALPVLVLGHAAGTAAGTALVNAVSIGVLGWLVARRLGPVAATLAMAACGLLAWSLGSEILYDPWSQHAPMIPFALFLVATWMVLAGDVVALPVLVVSGSYALQTHLSYIILVTVFAAVAFGSVAWRLVASWRASHRVDRRTLGWLAAGLGTALLCWSQPLIEQITAPGEGNVVGLWRSRDVHGLPVGPGLAVRLLGGTIALPPAWLAPSFGSPSFRLDGVGRPTWLAALGLAVIVAALAVLGIRARRRGSNAVAAGTAMALGAIALGYITVTRAPLQYGVSPNYVRWMWPLGMVVSLVLVVAVVEELMAARPQLRPHRVIVAGLAVTVVAALVVAVPTVDNTSASAPWTADAAHAISKDVVADLEGRGPVVVDLSLDLTSGAIGPALFSALQDAGIPFYVRQEPLVRQLGEARRFSPGDADVGIVVRGGPIARNHSPQEVPIASWSALSRADMARRAALAGEVERTLDRRGFRFAPGGAAYLRRHGQDAMVRDVVRLAHDPEGAMRTGRVCDLWSSAWTQAAGRPLLDDRGFPHGLLDRWCTLEDQAVNRRLTVYRSPA